MTVEYEIMDYITRIGNSSCAPIVIVDIATAPWLRFLAEFCAGFQLFSPKEYVENSLEEVANRLAIE